MFLCQKLNICITFCVRQRKTTTFLMCFYVVVFHKLWMKVTTVYKIFCISSARKPISTWV